MIKLIQRLKSVRNFSISSEIRFFCSDTSPSTLTVVKNEKEKVKLVKLMNEKSSEMSLF